MNPALPSRDEVRESRPDKISAQNRAANQYGARQASRVDSPNDMRRKNCTVRPDGISRANCTARTVRNKPSELHSQTGRNKPNELHGQTGRNKSSELHSQTGRNKSNKLYSQTGRNKSSELHSQTGRNKPSELHSQTGRRAAQNRLPKTRIAAELPRGKTELYSVDSDVSDLSDVFEIRQYVVGEDKSEKLLSLLGFAARARRLVFGTDLCRAAARAGQISLAIISSDASQNTKKRVVDACKYYGCDVCQSAVPSSILADRLGKSGVTAVVGLNDHNFIAGITALCARQTLDI